MEQPLEVLQTHELSGYGVVYHGIVYNDAERYEEEDEHACKAWQHTQVAENAFSSSAALTVWFLHSITTLAVLLMRRSETEARPKSVIGLGIRGASLTFVHLP